MKVGISISSPGVNAQLALLQVAPLSDEVAIRASVKPSARGRPIVNHMCSLAPTAIMPQDLPFQLDQQQLPPCASPSQDSAPVSFGGVPLIRLTPIARLVMSVGTKPQPSP